MNVDLYLPTNLESKDQVTDLDTFLSNISGKYGRSLVFFDEQVTGYVVYKGYSAGSFSVFLNASILPSDIEFNNIDDEGSIHSIYSIYSATLDDSCIVYTGDAKDGFFYTVWKFELPVKYPRRRFSQPKISVSCYLNEVDKVIAPLESFQSEELTPFAFANSTNILDQLTFLRTDVDDESLTPSSQIDNRIRYQEKEKDKDQSILTGNENDQFNREAKEVEKSSDSGRSLIQNLHCSVSFPISVSLVIKLKSTKPAGCNNVLLSTLNIESSEDLHGLNDKNVHFSILRLSIIFKGGEIYDLNPKSVQYPMNFQKDDSLNLTYRLINKDILNKDIKHGENITSKPVNIVLSLQVVQANGDPLSNVISTCWTPLLDFGVIAPPINSALKTSATTSTSSSKIILNKSPQLISAKSTSDILPTNSSTINGSYKNGLVSSNNYRKAALMNNTYKLKTASFLDVQQSQQNIPLPQTQMSSRPKLMNTSTSSVTVNLTASTPVLNGLRLTFNGKLSIELGKVTTWTLQAVNTSPNILNLSILVQPLMFPNSNTINNNQFSSSNLVADKATNSTRPIVYNPNQLYSLYNSIKHSSTGVFLLNNNISIGPLEPNSVFEAKLNLIGVHLGVFHLDGIKIFDVTTGEGLNFGKLVEVFVV